MALEASKHAPTLSVGGLMISLGIIYGDIGTSPLYVLTAIVGQREISRELIFGGVPACFGHSLSSPRLNISTWRLMLITRARAVFLPCMLWCVDIRLIGWLIRDYWMCHIDF